MLDIIFFAVISVFLFFKLKDEFGSENELDLKREEIINSLKKDTKSRKIKDVTNSSKKQKKSEELLEIATILKDNSEFIRNRDYSESLKSNILKYCNFSIKDFLKSAEKAMDMVVESVVNKDLDTLQFLLSDEIFLEFKNKIEKHSSKDQTLVNEIVSVLKCDFQEVENINKNTHIDLYFHTEQISFIRGKDDKIIKGSKTKMIEVKEIWSFQRLDNTEGKTWKITKIKNI